MDHHFGRRFDDSDPEGAGYSFLPLQSDQTYFGDYDWSPLPEATACHLQLPSFADSTSFTSELSDQDLTQGSTLSTGFDELISQEPRSDRCQADIGTPKQSCDDLSARKVDLQCIGVAPEIFVNGQVARPPLLPPEHELSTNLVSNGCTTLFHGGCELAVGLASATNAESRSSAGSSDLDLPYSTSPATDVPPPSSQLMVRGRSRGLSQEAREKAAEMRGVRACDRCRIRRVSCDRNRPCKRCSKNFPLHPEFCERRKLIRMLAQERRGIWLLDPNGGGWPGHPCDNPVHVTVAFEETLDKRPPGLNLALQPYITKLYAYPPAESDLAQQVSPAAATFGVVPMSTAGNWPGIISNTPKREYHLASFEPPQRLLTWAEQQVLSEAQKGESFEHAINTLIFALRDTPLEQDRATIVAPSNLVRNVCDMVSWIRIWQAPVIYVRGVDLGSGLPTSQPLPETAIWELKSQAITSMNLREREALSALDELRLEKIEADRLSVWACLWQMILIYRKLKAQYAEMYRPVCDTGQAYVAATVTTVEEIHRLLLVKYAAYFGSSSPIYHKSRQRPTLELIASDTRLRNAWEEVLRRRMEFYRVISQSREPLDIITKTLIIDVEARVERRARRRG